jgi:membrane associated rhomboid family serine protease
MLIPYGTNAPSYFRPYATLGIIACYGILYAIGLTLSESMFESLILRYGVIRPWQWVTWHAMHSGILHVTVDIFTLWTFGLLVEGIIGWKRFLGLYVGIGFVSAVIEQICTLFMSEGGALGASTIMYTLIALALIWTFKCQLHCWSITQPASVFKAPVLVLALVCLSFEFVMGIWSSNFVGSSLFIALLSESFHFVVGAVSGVAIGALLLIQKQVNCAGFDILSSYSNEEKPAEKPKSPEVALADKRDEETESTFHAVRNYLKLHRAEMAKKIYLEMLEKYPDWQLPEPLLGSLADGLYLAERWDDAITITIAYLQCYQEREVHFRMVLAQTLVEKLQRPQQALLVLNKLQGKQLSTVDTRKIEFLKQKIQSNKELLKQQEVVNADW